MKEDFKSLVILLLAILFYRIYILYNFLYDFYFDEAYYWFWSKHFDFGYYSKPPMIAWVIKLFTSVCGDSEFCIKLPSAILYFLSSVFIYFSAVNLYDRRVAFFASLIFFTLPSVFLSSIIIATDSVFLFFWSLALYLFIKVLKKDRAYLWVLLGVSIGFGLLSKYTMIFFPIGALIYLAFKRRDVFRNKNFYISSILAFLIFLPNLWWNFKHGFITFLHTKDNADIHGNLFHLNTLFEFLGSQFGVFGAVFFPVLLYLLFWFKRFYKDGRYFLLFWFIAPLFFTISLLSYISRAHANWSAPVFVGASILVSWFLVDRNYKKLLYFGIALNILLGVSVYHFDFFIKKANLTLNSKNDPYKKVRGWEETALMIQNVIKNYDLNLIFDNRMDMSEMVYYLKPNPMNAFFWNPSKKIENYFAMIDDLNSHKGEDFIFVSSKKRDNLKNYFKEVKFLKKVEYKIHKDYIRVYYIYLVRGFKGY